MEVKETGLHVHPDYSFLAASPDRLVNDNGDNGLLEIKRLISKNAMTPEEECQDKIFCCEIRDGSVFLKKKTEVTFSKCRDK